MCDPAVCIQESMRKARRYHSLIVIDSNSHECAHLARVAVFIVLLTIHSQWRDFAKISQDLDNASSRVPMLYSYSQKCKATHTTTLFTSTAAHPRCIYCKFTVDMWEPERIWKERRGDIKSITPNPEMGLQNIGLATERLRLYNKLTSLFCLNLLFLLFCSFLFLCCLSWSFTGILEILQEYRSQHNARCHYSQQIGEMTSDSGSHESLLGYLCDLESGSSDSRHGRCDMIHNTSKRGHTVMAVIDSFFDIYMTCFLAGCLICDSFILLRTPLARPRRPGIEK